MNGPREEYKKTHTHTHTYASGQRCARRNAFQKDLKKMNVSRLLCWLLSWFLFFSTYWFAFFSIFTRELATLTRLRIPGSRQELTGSTLMAVSLTRIKNYYPPFNFHLCAWVGKIFLCTGFIPFCPSVDGLWYRIRFIIQGVSLFQRFRSLKIVLYGATPCITNFLFVIYFSCGLEEVWTPWFSFFFRKKDNWDCAMINELGTNI